MPSCQVPVGSWDGTPTGSEPGLDLRGPSTAPAGPETSPVLFQGFPLSTECWGSMARDFLFKERGDGVAMPPNPIPASAPASFSHSLEKISQARRRQARHVGLQVLLAPLPAADQVDGRINSSLAYWRDLWCYWRRPVLALCGPEWPSRRGQ